MCFTQPKVSVTVHELVKSSVIKFPTITPQTRGKSIMNLVKIHHFIKCKLYIIKEHIFTFLLFNMRGGQQMFLSPFFRLCLYCIS